MKRLSVFVITLLLGTSLAFAQTSGDKAGAGDKTAADKTAPSDTGKKPHKGGKKGHKGGKKSKKGSTPDTAGGGTQPK